MQVTEALQARKSVRAFLDKPVSREQILAILDVARWSPSGSNTQPWQVAVVMGERKNQLQQTLEQTFLAGHASKPDYQYYPHEWVEPFQKRRVDCGMQLYAALNIARHDKEKRMAQWLANYHSFGAPVVILFFLNKILQTGSYMDYGMFLQSIMLTAVEQGLATCPQAALCDYAEVVREFLGYDANQVLVCGMALGYEDINAAVNNYRTPRLRATEFTQFFD